MIRFEELRRVRSVLLTGGVLALSISACVIPSRREPQSPRVAPAPAPVGPRVGQPAHAPLPPAVHRVAEPSAPPVESCETAYLPPFVGALLWRTAYRGSAAGSYHHCPGWSSFGPVRPNRKWHKGLDIAAPTGTPIRSAVSGTLSYGHDPNGWGLYARVRFTPSHRTQAGTCESQQPMEFIYAHLREDISPQALRAEVPVEAGTIVGRVGCSGNAAGMCSPSPESHVHLTLRKSVGNREKIDPLPIVGWTLAEPAPDSYSPPLLACPIAAGQTSASAR